MRIVAFLAALLIVVGNDIGPDIEDYCMRSKGNCDYDEDDDDMMVVLDDDEDGENHNDAAEYCLEEGKECGEGSDEGIDDNTRDKVAKRQPSYMDKLRAPLKYLWKATKQVASNMYNMTAETLQDIGEVVRIVLNDEAYNMVISAFETFQRTVMPAGRDDLFGHTLSNFAKDMLSVSILFLILVLNYFLSGFVSLLTLLLFDCLTLLAHGVLGPVHIANYIIDFFIFTYKFFSWAISYPYVFSLTVVSLFVLSFLLSSCVWPYVRRRHCPLYCRTTSDVMYDLEEKSRNMERMIKDLQKRTESIERMLRIVHDDVISRRKTENKPQNRLQPDE